SAPYDAFVVGVQADYLPHPSAQIHIVQNQSQVSETCFWLPHWLQPGLIPRDSSRTGLRTVGYAGQDYYLAGGRGRWENECRRLGLEFRMLSAENWHDFSSIDAVLAIRTFDHYEYDKKPATKLFNAWHVGTPLVAGNDSAFRQVGIPGADYLVVNSFEEAVSAIERLRDDGDLYGQIVEAGRRQALTFARERIAEAWIVFFRSIAIPRFEKWKEGNQGSRGHWIFVNSERLARTCFREARRKVLGPIGFKR
ncbi:MAG: glycosyltransferase, partial [Planctomycetaceae bacterium]